MNERYLFRGKIKDYPGWRIGYYMGEMKNNHWIRSDLCTNPEFVFANASSVEPETIGQCTGLRDKNGMLIFEGDIIRHGNFNNYTKETLTANHFVKWEGASFGIALPIIAKHYDVFEIIGNIHDNPELLKEDANV